MRIASGKELTEQWPNLPTKEIKTSPNLVTSMERASTSSVSEKEKSSHNEIAVPTKENVGNQMKEAVGAQRQLDLPIQGNDDQKWKSLFAANKMASRGVSKADSVDRS
ncbi:PREDICTED: uncharacterized protein LOC109230492 [Nicotiana attenuata]|uniref:uncharacterized protein LOC109230492 n=1 Tax=Nicotiana attenuata TaxID=49451 RepID=UPI000905C5C0|nr:PREDICTED: uncharacterized protein LOC109230492 [Nicotiana attenuata]